ncbi:hypothetical protein BGX29_005273 [Mortierella sp. GBA35]|nr:hypothetical protein BGX29_005273 [Mortierella sp. GBA35]
MTLTTNYSSPIATSTISSHTTSSSKMTVKPCVAKGHRECVQGFIRDQCTKCIKGSVPCDMCPIDPRTGNPLEGASCIFCHDGRKECDDCYGAGFVQRICRDCIKEHYRRQAPKSPLIKVTGTVLQATMGFVKGVHHQAVELSNAYDEKMQQQQQRRRHNGSTISLPESIDSDSSSSGDESVCSAASAPSSPTSSRRPKYSFMKKRLSLDHVRSNSYSSSIDSTDSTGAPRRSQHRRKWSWSSILTAA